MPFLYTLALIITVAGTAWRIWRRGQRRASDILDSLIGFYFFALVGLMGLFFFYEHAFNADAAAEIIGWPTGNPFQFEVSLNSLATGVAGIICLWWRGGFRWATALIFAIIYLGSDYGHVYQLLVNDNHHEGNTGLVLYTNVIVPGTLLILMAAEERLRRREIRGSRRFEQGDPAERQAA